MKRIFNFLILPMLLMLAPAMSMYAQDSPKREFRSVWLTTVWAIDWPNQTGNTAAVARSQQDFLARLMDRYVKANMNACCFQVRTMSDAFYKSSYEPWSQFLTGTRGAEPTYDPLEYAVEQAHKRGLELHAWVNPYRYSTGESTYGTLPTDYSNTHPDWIMTASNGYTILNPGIPEVREQIVRVVEEIVRNYDVDGILFDDYFYVSGTDASEDAAQYEAYNPDGLSLGDWRRQNVNKMVAEVYAAIKAIKPWCKFGIGPAGVAATDRAVAAKHGVNPCPIGSDWQYSGIYSDPLAWYEEHTIDYMAPQVYWTIGSAADYAQITPWWSEMAHHFGRHAYISQSLSNLQGSNNAPRHMPKGLSTIEQAAFNRRNVTEQTEEVQFYAQEIIDQININRASSKDGAPGSVFFSDKPFRTTTNFVNNLVQKAFIHPALTPAMTWYAPAEQGVVNNLQLEGNVLQWVYPDDNVRYAVYCVPIDELESVNSLSSPYLIGLTYSTTFTLPSSITTDDYAVLVTVVDRYGYEYAPARLGEMSISINTPILESPVDGESVLLPATLSWSKVEGATGYMIQIAADAQFEQILLTQTTSVNSFSTQPYSNIDGSTSYWWRVRAYAVGAQSAWSEPEYFTGRMFSVTSPANGAVDVEEAPIIEWDMIEGAIFYCQIADNSLFRQQDLVYSATVETNSLQVAENILLYGKTYYVRVRATIADREVLTPVSSFTVMKVDIPVPAIISPADGQIISTDILKVELQSQPNNGFRIELSQYDEFPSRYSKRVNTDANVFVAEFDQLTDGDWYLRAFAKTEDGQTEWSETVHVVCSLSSAVVDIKTHNAVAQKVMRNGQLYIILPDGKVYNALGQITSL